MVKKLKYIGSILLLCISLLVPLAGDIPCMAQEIATEDAVAVQSDTVFDEANLFSEEEKAELAKQAEDVKEETDWNIYLITTSDAQGKTAMQYADDFFDEKAGDGADGVALLIDMDNREIYISTAGEAIRYLTNRRIDEILDLAYGDIIEGRYAACMENMLDGVASKYKEGIPSNQYNYDEETGKTSRYHSITKFDVLIAIGIALLFAGLRFLFVVRDYRWKSTKNSYDYEKFGKLDLQENKDILVNTVVKHHKIERNDSSGGSSGKSSVHSSSSGSSHGGGGRSF